jgi:hypothetical protein
MSHSLEHCLDATLNMRERSRRQHEAELNMNEGAVRGGHAELERRRIRFRTEVQSLIQTAAERANRHLATRPERCEFCDVSEYRISPWYPGGSICNPITYKLWVDGQEVGEALVVELTRDGMIEALLSPSGQQTDIARISFGWHPVPLFSFDSQKAADVLVQYLAAITERWPLSPEKPMNALK